MLSRKHTAWKRSRTFGDIYGGRKRRKLTDGIFARLHSLRAPGEGVETPIAIEDNPSRDFYFPLRADECVRVIRGLPRGLGDGITHVWLRRPGRARRHAPPLAEFICGSGVRLITMYAWRLDRRLHLGSARPTGSNARHWERFGASLACSRVCWYVEFTAAALRDYCVHVLLHEVGHHVDEYRRRWSAANRNRREEAAEQYAVSLLPAGKAILSGASTGRGAGVSPSDA